MKKNECANMMVQYLFVQVCINIYMVSPGGTRNMCVLGGGRGKKKGVKSEHTGTQCKM